MNVDGNLLASVRHALGRASEEPLPLVLTVEEAAKCLQIGRGTAYESIRSGAIPSVRFQRSIRVPLYPLLALLGSGGWVEAPDGAPGFLVDQEHHPNGPGSFLSSAGPGPARGEQR